MLFQSSVPQLFNQLNLDLYNSDINTTFNQLTEWYLDQEPVKKLASYNIIEMKLNKFKEE